MSEQKRISLRLSEEKLSQIRERADSLHMSINQYLIHATNIELKQSGISYQEDPLNTKEAPQRLIIRLSEEQRETIRKRASERGLSIRQYMDFLLNQKSNVDIRIAVNDLEAVEKQVDDLITVFNGVASVIIRSGKIYEGELKTLLSSMQEINGYFKQLYQDEHDNRYQLYAECRKKIFEEIGKASFIRRNRIGSIDKNHSNEAIDG